MGASTPSREGFLYTSQYCEENAWHLLHDARIGADPAAIFISNAGRQVPLWSQRAQRAPDEPVVWDYHVVAAAGGQVWDLDTTLPFPCGVRAYLAGTFPLAGALLPELEPRFRLVPAAELFARFASDRSHMRRPDGTWLAPPPAWPAIRAGDQTMNLFTYVDMGRGGPGEVLDLPGLRDRLAP